MVVSFTPNIGLVKPDESEFALNWARNVEIQADNNVIIINKTNVELLTYTPTLLGSGVSPSSGAGTKRGEYQDIQGFITGGFVIEFVDPGVTAGSGEYAISLPAVVDNTFHTVDTAFAATIGIAHCIGEGYVQDAGSIGNSGSVALAPITIGGISYVRLVTETYTGKVSGVFNGTTPFVVATGDKFSGSFFYKKV